MDKRYQVFISSTYADLKEERQAVIKTVIESNCIPAGMELFPAADEAQLAFIKHVIDDCDYYLLIIGGRYGSVDESGVSYTEQEYEYAVSRGLWVIALLHEKPGEISLDKSEPEPVGRERLHKFRDKVSHGRLVKFWKNASELPGLVSLNLSHAMREHPATGWVRADRVANVEVLGEINELRKQKDALEAKVVEYEAALADPVPALPDLAGLDEEVVVTGKQEHGYTKFAWNNKTTWRKIFAHISPYLVSLPSEHDVKNTLTSALVTESGNSARDVTIDDQVFQTIGIQLKALGLIDIKHSRSTIGLWGVYWSLTPAGERLMMQVRTVRTKTS